MFNFETAFYAYRFLIMMPFFLRKSFISRFWWLILVFLFFPSCMPTHKDIIYLNDRIGELNRRMDKLEASLNTKLSGELNAKLKTIRENQAEVGSDIDKIREEMQTLTGRVDENSYLVKRIIERDTTDQDILKTTMAGLPERIDALEAKVAQQHQYLGLESSVAHKNDNDLLNTSGMSKKSGRWSPGPEKKAASPEEELYNSALASYKSGNYEKAITGFERFLKKYHRSKLADNAQFWIGECYMSLNRYEQAILAYQNVLKKYPKGNKVPNAMLRQAIAFQQIEDKMSYKVILERIIKKYPRSNEAKIARTKLKKIK